MYHELEQHLKTNIDRLRGDWIKKNSSYEPFICSILAMEYEANRYWDARWNGTFIEFKKGTSIWLDLVRYGEILLHRNEDAKEKTFNLFFIPDKRKSKITEIIGVWTDAIMKKLRMTPKLGEQLLLLKQIIPHSLNAQANLTVKDLREMQSFQIVV